MIAHNHYFLCKQAELYYYDFLCGGNQESIPECVLDHIEQCQHCHEQIDQFQVMLSQVDGAGPRRGQACSAIITMLELHFAYVGERVTCKTVRPFLPGLLDPALEIRIPTPITAHLDNCRQCAENLEEIRKLNINPKQLRRLSQLFVEVSSYDDTECSETEMAATARSVVAMDYSGVTGDDLGHLCKCSVCRNLLFDERQKLCDSLPKDVKSPGFSCDSVMATDIFDYVIPNGLDPTNDQYIKFRESLTSHLRSCPTCLAKMQELHRTIYNIADGPESEVVTIYHMDESTEIQAKSKPGSLYTGFPISVKVEGIKDRMNVKQLLSTVGLTTALKEKVSTMNLKYLTSAAVVAAVLLIGFSLLLYTSTARAVTIEQIYKAIEKVKNVHISSFIPDKTEPIQETWVSRKSNIYMTRMGEDYDLWDIANRIKKVTNLNTGSTKTTSLSDNVILTVQERINSSLGLMPFYDIFRIPSDTVWHRLDDKSLEVAKGIEIYDLDWTEEKHGGSTILRKWRVFTDIKEHLPQRIEWYNKSADGTEFVLETVLIIEYMNENQIQAAVEKAFF